MFSSRASRSIASSAVPRTIAGMRSSSAACAARQRRSPITSWNELGETSRTTIGCSRPNSRIECCSSASASSSNEVRGCLGLGWMAPTGISRYSAPAIGTGAGSVSTAIGGPELSHDVGRSDRSIAAGPVGISAARPRPSPPLRSAMVNYRPSLGRGGSMAAPRSAISRAAST
jgi:hypothetical protein